MRTRMTLTAAALLAAALLFGGLAKPGLAQEQPKFETPPSSHPERAAAARLPLPRKCGADVPRLRPAAVSTAGAGSEGRAERRADPARRRRLRPVQHFRRRRALAHDGQAGRRRAALQPLPHDRACAVQRGPHSSPAATTTRSRPAASRKPRRVTTATPA